MGGGYFQFFTKNRPQKHQKRAILHTSQANGGARAPPAPPPGYATASEPSSCFRQKCLPSNWGCLSPGVKMRFVKSKINKSITLPVFVSNLR